MDPIIINIISALVGFSGGFFAGRKTTAKDSGTTHLNEIELPEIDPDILNFDLDDYLNSLSDEEVAALKKLFEFDENAPSKFGVPKVVTKYVVKYIQKKAPTDSSQDRNVLDRPEPITLRFFQDEALVCIDDADKGIVQLPTGTGKSVILSRAIIREIGRTEPAVYVILSPKIILSNQLMLDVRKDLILNDTECEYAIVHSDKTQIEDDDVDLEWFKVEASSLFESIPEATTDPIKLRALYNRSVKHNVPLVISCTYHSAKVIMEAGIPVHFTGCDEAHRLAVSDVDQPTQTKLISSELLGFGEEDFVSYEEPTKKENWAWIVEEFKTTKQYFFTATLKVTEDDSSFGMNNDARFGKLLYSRSPKEMIDAGEIVQPILHRIDIEGGTDTVADDVHAVVEAFKRHRAEINTGAKLLVVARKSIKGVSHLDTLASSEELKNLRYTHPNLTVFDISSVHKPRINGEIVSKPKFLKELRELGNDSSKEAIIIHINILTEGIDVPGITGEMYFAPPPKIKFMQTTGRGSRLHPIDRKRLYSGEIEPGQHDKMVKPYNWVIIPLYNEEKDRFRKETIPLIKKLRDDYGFDSSQHFVTPKYRKLSRDTDRQREKSVTPEGLLELEEFEGWINHDLEKPRVREEVRKMSDDEVLHGDLLDIEPSSKKLYS